MLEDPAFLPTTSFAGTSSCTEMVELGLESFDKRDMRSICKVGDGACERGSRRAGRHDDAK